MENKKNPNAAVWIGMNPPATRRLRRDVRLGPCEAKVTKPGARKRKPRGDEGPRPEEPRQGPEGVPRS